MAVGDFEFFTPAESLYTKPGAADERARQAVIKRANYLSQMDQFYAELAETKREFDLEYGLHARAQALAEKEQADVSAFRREELAVQKELGEAGIATQREAIRKQYEASLAGTAGGIIQTRIAQKSRTPAALGATPGTTLGHPEPFQHTSDIMAQREQALREAALRGGY